MGKYDIPAAVDYVLNTTGAKDLYYIGHSMGTTMFWVAMNQVVQFFVGNNRRLQKKYYYKLFLAGHSTKVPNPYDGSHGSCGQSETCQESSQVPRPICQSN